MSGQTKQRDEPAPRLRQLLAPHVDELEDAADGAADLATEDVAAVLAAIARGEDPPAGAVQRIQDRIEEGQ